MAGPCSTWAMESSRIWSRKEVQGQTVEAYCALKKFKSKIELENVKEESYMCAQEDKT